MNLLTILFVSLMWCSQSLGEETHDVSLPVYFLDQKYVVIDGYHGNMDARTLELFGNVETLVFQNCNFSSYNENHLHPLRSMRKFIIVNSYFNRVKNDISVCCKNLREFEMIGSDVSPIDEDTLKKVASVKAMERLYLLRMDMPVFISNALNGSNLKEIEILHSNLAKIEDGAFNGMDKLEELDLQHNKLTSVPKASIAGVKTLRKLNLKGNLLEKVTADDFPLLPNLEKLNLGYNPIKEINLRGLKEKLPNIKRVIVSGIDIDPSDAEGIPLLKMRVG